MDELLRLLDMTKDECINLGFCDEDFEEYDEEEKPFDPMNYTPIFKYREDKPNISHKDLAIKPFINEGDTYITTHKDLPKIPFSALVSGARGSGKSVLSAQILCFLNGYFDKVILYSPTANLDMKWKLCFEKLGLEWKVGDTVFYEYSEIALQKQMKAIKKLNKGKITTQEKMKVLFIFDDMITQLPKNKRNTVFNKLLLNNRQYAASIIVISQSYMLLDSNFRKNCSQIFLWKTENQKELQNFTEELSGCLGSNKRECRENFTKLYEEATKLPFSCLYINYHQPIPEHRFHRNFDEVLKLNNCSFFKTKQIELIEEDDSEDEYIDDSDVEDINKEYDEEDYEQILMNL